MNMFSPTIGQLHSIETLGTVDGPGIRYVVFTQGCPLRCLYCHNPECRYWEDGKPTSVDELMTDILRYRSYLRSPGGVTISGGEPLMQPEFTANLLKRCHAVGLHTVLDTSGYTVLSAALPVLEHTDLILLDIKSFDPDIYQRLTGVSLAPTLQFARYLSDINKPVWIRFVLVPGITDDPDNVKGLAQFVSTLNNVQRVEILPFHKMGEYKWKQLGYEYKLENVEPPTLEAVQTVVDIFKSYSSDRYLVLSQSLN